MSSLNRPVELEPEKIWLRRRVKRLRDVLRLIADEHAADAIEDLIAEAEDRRDQFEGHRHDH
jgi:hypothetical protein